MFKSIFVSFILLFSFVVNAQVKLFEIKDSQDHTIFEVSDDGIRIFSAAGDTIMAIANNDIKAYVSSSSKRGVDRDFNIGDMGSRDRVGNNVFKVSKKAETDIYDGPMMLWYPQKEAFRVGNVLIESPANVGLNSFATGYKSQAKKSYSQALGKDCIADGVGSAAIGTSDTASASYAFAMGKDCHAAGTYSIALGYEARTGTAASSVAFGWDTRADAQGSMAMGHLTHTYNTGIPGSNFHNGYYSFAMGDGAKASGAAAASIGKNTNAHGYYSFAQGYGSSAKAPYTVAMGLYTVAQAQGLTVVGRYNKIYGDSAAWQYSNPLFVVGNGYSTVSRNDAFTVLRNGDVIIDDLYTTTSSNSKRYVQVDSNGKLCASGAKFPSDGDNSRIEKLEKENQELKLKVDFLTKKMDKFEKMVENIKK